MEIGRVEEPAAPRRIGWWLAAVVLAAVGLRVLCALNRSLRLDEFHSLHHARPVELGRFLSTLREDNHAPLYFLVLRAAVAALGDGALAVRLPSIVCGAAAVALLGSLARRHVGERAAVAAAAMLACASLHVVVSAEARMYALLTLAVLGLSSALLDALDGRRSGGRTALWLVVGLHTHYFFLHYLVVLGAAVAGVAALDPGRRRRLSRLGPWSAVALAVAVPWYAWGFAAQLRHDLRPGGERTGLLHLPEALVHLGFHNVRLAGELPRMAFLVAATLSLLLAAGGVVELLRPGRKGSRAVGVLVTAAAFGVPLWSWLVSLALPRSGFHWTYLAASCPAFALLVAAQPVGARLRRAALAIVLAAACALASIQALHEGTENYRDAVAAVLAEYRPGDALLVVEPGPALFPTAIGWTYYARRSTPGGGKPPARLELGRHHALPREDALEGAERALLLQRSLGDDFHLLMALRRTYAEESVERFGYGIFVHRFSKRRGD